MLLFARCNIDLECPQNVSVKCLPKILNKSFIITAGKFIFGVCLKRGDLECMALSANELLIPAPSPEEDVAYTSLCIAYQQQ